jgi:hypothetical protein
MYSVAYVVDDDGKAALIELARPVDKKGGWPACSTCYAQEGELKGFQAQVRGEVTEVGDGTLQNPSRMRILDAVATISEADLCSSVPAMPASPAPTSAPVTSTLVTPAPVAPAPTSKPVPASPAPTSAPVTSTLVTPAPVAPAPTSKPAPESPAPTSAPVTSTLVTPAPVAPAPTSKPVSSAPVIPAPTSEPETPTPSAAPVKIYTDHCFSGSNIVEVLGKGVVTMDNLKIGDFVESGGDKFSRVYSFGHIDHELEATFLQLKAGGLDTTPLEITKDHILFVKGKATRASDVQVGDILSSGKVHEIKTVKRRGVYVPMTESGKIVVSGVLSSSYVVLLDVPIALQHYGTHAFMAPLRLMCAFDFGLCENETYTEGISNFIVDSVSLVSKVSEFPAVVQLFAFLVASPFLLAAYLIEMMILGGGPLSISVLILSFYYEMKRRGGKPSSKLC